MGATRDVAIWSDGAASPACADDDGFIEFTQLRTRLAGRSGSGRRKTESEENKAV